MLRNHGSTKAKNLDSALQQASEKAIAHLVNASAEIAKSMEIAKAYMREREELEEQLPRWSTLGGTPRAENTERVHRVAPMMMEGRCVQPVVELNRTILLRGGSGRVFFLVRNIFFLILSTTNYYYYKLADLYNSSCVQSRPELIIL